MELEKVIASETIQKSGLKLGSIINNILESKSRSDSNGASFRNSRSNDSSLSRFIKMQMTWNEYILEYEGIFIQMFKSCFVRNFNHFFEEIKFKSVNYPKISKRDENKTVCIDILNTIIVKEEINHPDQLKIL